jgi:prefoldin beta subunit
MEELPPQLRHQIAQFQQAQQQAQALTVQKQQLELALHETERALEELDKLEEGATVYKSVGGILIKAGRDDVKKELTERKETLDLRIKTVERQEGRILERLREMREKLQEALKARQPPGGEAAQ